MDDKFMEWLTAKVEQAGSIRRFAQRAGVSHTSVADVLAGVRQPTFEFCVAVANAANEHPEKILRLAGLLPRLSEKAELLEEFIFFWDQLPEPQQRNLMRVAWAMALAREADGPLTIEVEPPGIPANPETCNP